MNNIGDSWWDFTNYKPHSGQEAVHGADNRFRCVIAGRRWGKSLCAAKEIERYMMLPNKMIWSLKWCGNTLLLRIKCL